MALKGDIDIDLADRNLLLTHIQHIPAAMRNIVPNKRHSSGVYVTDLPYDPITNMASIDYTVAEDRGYFKLDLLNVWVYTLVRDEEHLYELMKEPDWEMLKDKTIVNNLIHLANHYDAIRHLKEPINSIPRLAMFLAAIRPSKRHLLGRTFKEMAEFVWLKDDSGYVFKKSHSLAYAQLVVVHMNLIKELGLEKATIQVV